MSLDNQTIMSGNQSLVYCIQWTKRVERIVFYGKKSLNIKKHRGFQSNCEIIANFLMTRNIELLRYNVLYNICTYRVESFIYYHPKKA